MKSPPHKKVVIIEINIPFKAIGGIFFSFQILHLVLFLLLRSILNTLPFFKDNWFWVVKSPIRQQRNQHPLFFSSGALFLETHYFMNNALYWMLFLIVSLLLSQKFSSIFLGHIKCAYVKRLQDAVPLYQMVPLDEELLDEWHHGALINKVMWQFCLHTGHDTRHGCHEWENSCDTGMV